MKMSSLMERLEGGSGSQVLTEGYTHYFGHKGWTDKGWLAFTHDVAKIVKKAKKEMPVEFSSDGTSITFNGVGKDGHEDLFITLAPQGGFNFVKTGGQAEYGKPYDKFVVEILKAAKKHNPTMTLKSDGGAKVFGEAVRTDKQDDMGTLVELVADAYEALHDANALLEKIEKGGKLHTRVKQAWDNVSGLNSIVTKLAKDMES